MKQNKKEYPIKDYNKTNRNFERPNEDNKESNGPKKIQPEKYPVSDPAVENKPQKK